MKPESILSPIKPQKFGGACLLLQFFMLKSFDCD